MDELETSAARAKIEAQIAELRALKHGWFNGWGEAITEIAMAKAEEVALDFLKRGIRVAIFPSPLGGASVETVPVKTDVYILPDGLTETIDDDDDDGDGLNDPQD